jgi:hypothetical protein
MVVYQHIPWELKSTYEGLRYTVSLFQCSEIRPGLVQYPAFALSGTIYNSPTGAGKLKTDFKQIFRGGVGPGRYQDIKLKGAVRSKLPN